MLSDSIATDNFVVLHAAHDYVYAEGKFLKVKLQSQRVNESLMWTDVAKLLSAGGMPISASSSNVGGRMPVSPSPPTEFVFKLLDFCPF